ncbi:MAG: AbrB/MazE/SpoVT family DNA-binding domain-containing protein [Alphaproteobacteria bacterium]|nr:AbrB/MazE/SpoVT family DNA-binding domain-containing protein [Alphaproteobacteria bacterium]
MKARIARWGNSLALRIPARLAEEIDLREDSAVEIVAERGRLVMRPAARRYDIRALAQDINAENRHEESDFGPSRGREAW